MLVHGIDVKVWSKRYDLEPFSYPCGCGRMQSTTIPFASGPLRGLIAPVCECGHPNPPYCAGRIDNDGKLPVGL